MRKKQLAEENQFLREQLKAAELTVADLNEKLAACRREVGELTAEKERLEAKLNATQPLKTLEAKVVRQSALSEEMRYGASVIGKMVVEAAKCCNALTARFSAEEAKEPVNLILGRTEVAKAEILELASSGLSLEEKKKQMEQSLLQTSDYFASMMAQDL